MKYVSKQDVINKGIIKKGNKIQKLSLLEIWHSKGFLKFDQSCYSADDRLEYGLRLALDFHVISRANLHSGYIQNTKIDNACPTKSVAFFDAINRYNQVIKSIPSEFWPIVRQICIEEKDVVYPDNLSERQKNYIS